MKIVISQSMFFPWIGFLEQIKLADIFVHYDDVQFSKGSFTNRVQIKTPRGQQWLTVPLKDHHLGQRIDEVQFPPMNTWCDRHWRLLKESFSAAPYAKDVFALVEEVYSNSYENISCLAKASFMALVHFFGLEKEKRFLDVRDLEITGTSSDRVLQIVRKLHGSTYITGLGALKYLDHDKFDSFGISVEYMDYRKTPYPQMFGEFTPFVSALDLIANCGKDGSRFISSSTGKGLLRAKLPQTM